MFDSDFIEITAKELKRLIGSRNEKDYLIVDVRQPVEYTEGHIPGAKFIPLPELAARLSDLPKDREMVFYCLSGGRSLAAATMVSEEKVTDQKLYNLKGGILAWEGKTLKGFPKIQVFDKSKEPHDLLLTAMDLEKGAWRFYTYISENLEADPMGPTLKQLAEAEIAHAKTVFGFWKKAVSTPPPFDELYAELKGEILEGGEKLSDMLVYLERLEENRCLHILELALHIEYTAVDLYRTMAEQAKDPAVRDTFLTIAQAEKNHMRALIRAIDQCA